jgi:hypothetical protein
MRAARVLNNDGYRRMMDNKLLRRWEAARYLEARGIPISASTLAKKATNGGGPVFRKFDRFPLYSAADLDAWVS